jgi:hypothetical protein
VSQDRCALCWRSITWLDKGMEVARSEELSREVAQKAGVPTVPRGVDRCSSKDISRAEESAQRVLLQTLSDDGSPHSSRGLIGSDVKGGLAMAVG